MTKRPMGAGLYATFNLGAHRRDDLSVFTNKSKDLSVLVGMQFGRLTVMGASKIEDSGGIRRTVCECDCSCGGKTKSRLSNLNNGSSISCGCLRREMSRSRATVHGHTSGGKPYSPEFNSWQSMFNRTRATAGANFECYGARGITICERWMKFENFLSDMGQRPHGTTLDRINNDGNYEPGNCRWATAYEQTHNRRLSKKSSSGERGVFRYKKRKWIATVTVGRFTLWSGIFSDVESAVKAREKWMLEHSLRSTHRDANPLAAQPDPDAPLTMRAPRKLGTTPAQVQARLQAALERRPQDYQPEAIERLLADVRGG